MAPNVVVRSHKNLYRTVKLYQHTREQGEITAIRIENKPSSRTEVQLSAVKAAGCTQTLKPAPFDKLNDEALQVDASNNKLRLRNAEQGRTERRL